MSNFRGAVVMFALAISAMSSDIFSSRDSFQYQPTYHGGSGHGSSGRTTNRMDKRLLNRRKKEKAARRARRKKK